MVEAKSGMVVQADTIYVIPPEREAILRDRILLLKAYRLASIKIFLQSVAADQHECVIAVILAGIGAKAFPGMKRIKEEGGLVIVQEGDDEGPSDALDVKLADLVSRPFDIPQHSPPGSRKELETAKE